MAHSFMQRLCIPTGANVSLVPLRVEQFQEVSGSPSLKIDKRVNDHFPPQGFRRLAVELAQAPLSSGKLDLVVNPCAGFDLSALTLFPQASRYLLLDKFPLFRDMRSEMFPYRKILFGSYSKEAQMRECVTRFGIVPLFMGAITTYLPHLRPIEMFAFVLSPESRPHFYMRFDQGEGTKEQELVYINTDLRNFKGDEFWLRMLDTASYPALLVKSAMGLMSESHSPWFYAGRFKEHLQARLERGRSLLFTGFEEHSEYFWEFASTGFMSAGKCVEAHDEGHLFRLFTVPFGYGQYAGAFLNLGPRNQRA